MNQALFSVFQGFLGFFGYRNIEVEKRAFFNFYPLFSRKKLYLFEFCKKLN